MEINIQEISQNCFLNLNLGDVLLLLIIYKFIVLSLLVMIWNVQLRIWNIHKGFKHALQQPHFHGETCATSHIDSFWSPAICTVWREGGAVLHRLEYSPSLSPNCTNYSCQGFTRTLKRSELPGLLLENTETCFCTEYWLNGWENLPFSTIFAPFEAYFML